MAVKSVRPPPVAPTSRIPLFSHRANAETGSNVGKETIQGEEDEEEEGEQGEQEQVEGEGERRGRGESVGSVYKSNSREQASSAVKGGESGRREGGETRSPLASRGESGELGGLQVRVGDWVEAHEAMTQHIHVATDEEEQVGTHATPGWGHKRSFSTVRVR